MLRIKPIVDTLFRPNGYRPAWWRFKTYWALPAADAQTCFGHQGAIEWYGHILYGIGSQFIDEFDVDKAERALEVWDNEHS